MANEISMQYSMQVAKGNLNDYKLFRYSANMAGTPKGPIPGALTVSVHGTDIIFSGLVQPGICRLTNIDATNFVTVGVFDKTASAAYPNGHFLPLAEILPGESYPMRITRKLTKDVGSGTGSVAGISTMRIMADTAPCVIVVEGFET
jgi:hypothetical protein